MKSKHGAPTHREENKRQPHLSEKKHPEGKEHSANNPLAPINQPKPAPPSEERTKKNEGSESAEARFQRRYLTTQWLLVSITLLYSLFSIAQWYESGQAVTAMNRANELADQGSAASGKREAAANQRADRSSRESSRRADASLEESRRLNTLTADMVAEARRQAEASRQQSARDAAASLELARKSLEESKRALEVSQRAWLGFYSATNYTPEPGVRGIVHVTIGNSGRLPATAAKIWMNSQTKRYDEPGLEPEEPSGIISLAVIHPGYPQTSPIEIYPLSSDQIEAVKKGVLIIYIVGVVSYDDGFGRNRRTLFCIYHQPGDKAGWNLCATGNKAE
jgi:hypothetical protein